MIYHIIYIIILFKNKLRSNLPSSTPECANAQMRKCVCLYLCNIIKHCIVIIFDHIC